jgi:hypothetical protein
MTRFVEEDDMEHARWLATIHYNTDAGPLTVDHAIEEIEDLHDIVEAGPNFYTIDQIVIVIAKNIEPGLTVEKAEAL